MRKKIIAVVMLVVIACSSCSCRKNGQGQLGRSRLIIGQLTDLTGDFGSGFTNGAADAMVKSLLSGYETVSYTRNGTYEINPTVVKSYYVTENKDHSKTFYYKINSNLCYNNGLRITAKDYVCSILLGSSPIYEEFGAYATAGSPYVGYEEFHNGETNTFEGVRLYSDFEFSVTVAAQELPYFYELSLVSIGPTPTSYYFDEENIYDMGDGACLSGKVKKEMIEKAVNEQRYRPTITCGPYQFVTFDAASKQAILTINKRFAGTYDGVVPQIDMLVFRKVQEETMLDELQAGSVDLLTNVSGGSVINLGLDLVDFDLINCTKYLRNGYGKITFVCDYGPTQFKNVRQAIAYCLDRTEFAAQYSGGFAKVVNGYYGLGQWQYKKAAAKLQKELNPYVKNIDKAIALLEEDGWIYNYRGEPFQQGIDNVRCKYVDGELMPCIIQWGSVENQVSQLLATMLPADMASAGMKLVITSIDFSLLLSSLSTNGSCKRNFHMFNMGVSFPRITDPYYYYSCDQKYAGYNDNKIYDKELEGLARILRETDSEDTETYLARWIEFEKRWNQVLPDLPLYSDEYHDFYSKKLKNYVVSADWGASDQIVYCYISDTER